MMKKSNLFKITAAVFSILLLFGLGLTSCGADAGDDNTTVTSSYKVGQIVLADGTLVEPSSYTAIDTVNPPVAVVAFEMNGKFYGVGLHTSSKLRWARSGTTGYNTKFTDIVCTPSGTASTATFTGDTDGSDNWSVICSVDTEESVNAATNYPGFNWANTYGTTHKDYLGNATEGWYMPSIAELCYVYRNLEAINATLSVINKLDSSYADSSLGTSWIWSSSQNSVSINDAWFVGFGDGDVGHLSKDNKFDVLVVRDFAQGSAQVFVILKQASSF